MAHNAGGSLQQGIPAEKLDKVWEFRSSPLFSPAERVALEFAIAAASQPNDVTDELFAQMKQHWNDGQIVESGGPELANVLESEGYERFTAASV